MKVKFESKSNRVKGLTFHPIRPWLLASLHNGVIQLWDYRIQQMIDKFEEHEGPVRGIDFHENQPLFVSGGDDYKIKGWNYKQKKCLFTLTGHLDYIRTVQFHNELPWILSCSDDQTIRIWNWQNRTQLSILAGHSHYVMCAKFHPTSYLIVSCGLDQQIRIWDYNNLRNKYNERNRDSKDIEVEIKCVLEGHDRAVNWVDFHISNNMVVSGGDDKKIKLWKYNDNKGWEYDTIYGHSNNVCCVGFRENLSIIISAGEDKALKIWDFNKRMLLMEMKKEDRFWVFANHRKENIIAAGHDNGFMIISLTHDRIPYVRIDDNYMIFIQGNQMFLHSLNTHQQKLLLTLNSIEDKTVGSQYVTSIYYNHFDKDMHQLLINIHNKDDQLLKYHLYIFNLDFTQLISQNETGYSVYSCFIAKNKILKLKNNSSQTAIQIYDYEKQLHKSQQLLSINKLQIFPAGINRVIYQHEDNIILFDLSTNKPINQIQSQQKLKQIIWNDKRTQVILICKRIITVANKDLIKINQKQEKFNIKSAIYCKNDQAILYSTQSYLKYLLANGDNGIIKCLDNRMYLVNHLIKDNKEEFINYIDGEQQKCLEMKIEVQELEFKLNLLMKNSDNIKEQLRKKDLLGESMISHLYKKNYSALALQLIEDKNARFELAIESGNLEIGLQLASELKQKEVYEKLNQESLRQGNLKLYEMCLQQQKSFEQLSLNYLIDNNRDKLQKMLQIAQHREDVMSRFQNSLLINDIEERIRILAEQGQLVLAYLMSVIHNQQEMAQELKLNLTPQQFDQASLYLQQNKKHYALLACRPIRQTYSQVTNFLNNQIHDEDFLILNKATLIQDQQQSQQQVNQDQLQFQLDEVEDQYQQMQQQKQQLSQQQQNNEKVTKKWAAVDDDDLDLDDELDAIDKSQQELSSKIQSQQHQQLQQQQGLYCGIKPKIKSNKVSILNYIQNGEFEQGLLVLKKQIGLQDITKYKDIFVEIYSKQQLMVSLVYNEPQFELTPIIIDKQINIKQLKKQLEECYFLLNEYQLEECMNLLRKTLLQIPLLTEDKDNEHLIIMEEAKEYIIAVLLEMEKRDKDKKIEEIIELNLHQCLCKVKEEHQVLFYKSAMLQLYKEKCFVYSNWVSGRLQQMQCEEDILQKAKKVQQLSATKASNAVDCHFEKEWFTSPDQKIDLISFTSLLNVPILRCPFCNTKYCKDHQGKICVVCQVSQIGQQVLGIKI